MKQQFEEGEALQPKQQFESDESSDKEVEFIKKFFITRPTIFSSIDATNNLCEDAIQNSDLTSEDIAYLKALNTFASFFPTKPYTAVLQYRNNEESGIIISLSKERFKDKELLAKRFKALSNYVEKKDKYSLYKELYCTSHPYVVDALKQYFKINEADLSADEQKLMNEILLTTSIDHVERNKGKIVIRDDAIKTSLFKNFLDWSEIHYKDIYLKKFPRDIDKIGTSTLFPITKELENIVNYKFEKIAWVYSKNDPHVEMAAINKYEELTSKSQSSLKLGLAPIVPYLPSTCEACTVQIAALNTAKVIDLKHLYSQQVAERTSSDTKFLDSILKRPKKEKQEIAKSILGSKLMISMLKRVNNMEQIPGVGECFTVEMANLRGEYSKELGKLVENAPALLKDFSLEQEALKKNLEETAEEMQALSIKREVGSSHSEASFTQLEKKSMASKFQERELMEVEQPAGMQQFQGMEQLSKASQSLRRASLQIVTSTRESISPLPIKKAKSVQGKSPNRFG